MSRLRRLVIGGALLAAGCGFSPTGPFEGFDGKGTRLRGSFDTSAANSGVSAQSNEVRASAASPQGLRVSLQERPNIAVTVGADGTFVLEGLPAGSWTLVFVRDGQVVGEIRFRSVRRNQEITIVVTLTGNGEVVLVQEQRDTVSFQGECPRGAGFWCQNQGGQNPNLTAEQFDKFAEDAAALTGQADALKDPTAIAAAVCNTGNQLLRQLATLSLNLAAGTLQTGTTLTGETYATVGAAFQAGIDAANGNGGDRERIKDVLERINENRNHDACDGEPLPDEDSDSDDDDNGRSGGLTCHGVPIPAGQLPPPGECKIWNPLLPAGQQGPPGNCTTLGNNLPAGSCLVGHNGVLVEG